MGILIAIFAAFVIFLLYLFCSMLCHETVDYYFKQKRLYDAERDSKNTANRGDINESNH